MRRWDGCVVEAGREAKGKNSRAADSTPTWERRLRGRPGLLGEGPEGLLGTGAHSTSRASKVLTCVWIPWKAVLLWPQSFLTPFEMLLAFSEVSHFRTPNCCSENACQYINCVCSYEHLHLFSMNFEHAIGNYSHLLAENCSHDGLVQSCRTMSS